MFDGMLNLLTYMGTMWLTNGELPQPVGSSHEYTVPWQAFSVKDGYVVVATRQDAFWRKLCQALDRPDLAADARFTTNASRVEHRAILVPELEAILATKTIDEWMALFKKFDVPAAPVNNLDRAFAEPPVAERGMIAEYDHPKVGKVRLPGNPIRMSDMGTISKPAPLLGEHTDEVLGGILGLSAEAIAGLKDKGVIK
jgi:crotonobetainyl-CoA:carnitine CoA-transferase CaiB-like acyl-CoA transferase